MSDYLPTDLLTCPPACLATHLPTGLPTHLPRRTPTHIPSYIPAYMPSYIPASLAMHPLLCTPCLARATSLMKQEYKEEILSLDKALSLAIKVLTKTCDATALTPEKFDLATLTKGPDGPPPHAVHPAPCALRPAPCPTALHRASHSALSLH